MDKFQINYANYNDNNELLKILFDTPILSKSLGYYTDKSPNYFEFLNSIYDTYKVITVRKNNKILGFVNSCFYNVYLNGEIVRVSYLSELRLNSKFRRLNLAENLLIEAVRVSKNIPIFTCIAKDNKIAKKKWENLSKSNIITLNTITNINTYFILPIKANIRNKFVLRNANYSDIVNIFQLWNTTMINRNLAQYFTYEEFNKLINIIGINNFILCIDNNKIVSFLALWNQNNIRKFILSNKIKYSNIFNFILRFLKIPKLPNKDEIINFYCITNLCIPIEYTDSFKYLLNYSINFINSSKFIAIALDENDILNNELKRFYFSKSQLELLSNKKYDNSKFQLEIAHG